MTTDEWLEKVAADRPPLSREQIAVLRPILAPTVPAMRSAAPAVQAETAPQTPANTKGITSP
jgi:hypothetical protein